MDLRARRQKLLRVGLLLQAMGLLAVIAFTVPDYVDAQLHPPICTGICLDLRGVPFGLTMVVFGPVVVLLLLLAWRWRGPSQWPLAVVGVVDAAAIALVTSVVIEFVHTRNDSLPPVAAAPSLLLLPALITVALGANLVRPLPWKPIVAVSTAGCLLSAVLMSLSVIGPVRQRIPGEVSLPFSKMTAYEGRELGCQDVSGGLDSTARTCTRATLVIYRGSGDASSDQATIFHSLVTQKRAQPGDWHVGPLPVSMYVGRSYDSDVDASNAGFCLIITDRIAAAPTNRQPTQCGMPADYADIRSHWPADDAYAIGIIYYSSRQGYR
jgi:hypothetical protein